MSKSTYIQQRFNGGMNLSLEATRVPENQYRLAFNLRSRYDVLQQVKDHRPLGGAPQGKMQGLYALNDYLVLFCSGKAYYKLIDSELFLEIPGIQMDPDVERIYVAFVPASDNNFGRDPSGPVVTATINGTPAAMVVQDGVNQPHLVFADLTNRPAQTYNQWSLAAREYVPIGKHMLFFNGMLLVVSPDGTSIYRSVQGRPLDFVINVTQPNGDKGGDATTTSYAVDFETITCVAPLNANAFFVSTRRTSYAVQLDTNTTLFGEPTFTRQVLFPVGCVNQFSFVDILGDFGFVDIRGLRSFNAVQQLSFNGQNSLFSQTIAPIFDNILQDTDKCCVGSFDNYCFFSVNTTLGNLVVVYDTLTRNYVCLEKTQATPIKQFATLSPSAFKFYAITDDAVWELYGSDTYLGSVLQTRSFASDDPLVEMKPSLLRVVVEDTIVDGNLYATSYVDKKQCAVKQKAITKRASGIPYPVVYPVMFSSGRKVENILLRFDNGGLHGYHHNYTIRWDGGAQITNISITNPNVVTEQSQAQQSKTT